MQFTYRVFHSKCIQWGQSMCPWTNQLVLSVAHTVSIVGCVFCMSTAVSLLRGCIIQTLLLKTDYITAALQGCPVSKVPSIAAKRRVPSQSTRILQQVDCSLTCCQGGKVLRVVFCGAVIRKGTAVDVGRKVEILKVEIFHRPDCWPWVLSLWSTLALVVMRVANMEPAFC